MIKQSIAAIILVIAFYFSVSGQVRPLQIDGFGPVSNDDLQARVENLWNQIKDGSQGVVILTSTKLANHLNKRRIEGCNLMRRYPQNSLIFLFEIEGKDYSVEFWKLPPGSSSDSRFMQKTIEYDLPDLHQPFELTNAMATDDFCPRHFDLEWYAHFMSANPTFKGKAVFDTSKGDFLRRVTKYRKHLIGLGVKTSRVTFLRGHFPHETDEQWWLIPVKKP